MAVKSSTAYSPDSIADIAASNVSSSVYCPVILTDNAAHKVASLIAEEENHNLSLRVYIAGGGCSGFQYGFRFDENKNADDTALTKEVTLPPEAGSERGPLSMTVTLLIDPMSLQYLEGATIDYKEDLSGAQFVIKNPNAQTTCGCGSSFSVG